MANESIRSAFERFWQHVVAKVGEKADITYVNEAISKVYQSLYGVIDGTIETVDNDKALQVSDYGFYKHGSIKSVNFAAATSIGNYAFYQCPSLELVNVPLAKEIGMFAFRGCSALNTINFPNATTVGNGIFDECINLSTVNFDKLSRISPLMFRKCEMLTTVTLPAVTSIGTQAFYDSGITSLTLSANTVCALESPDAFYFTPIEEGTGYIYVPAGLVNSYKAAEGWSNYADQIRAIA